MNHKIGYMNLKFKEISLSFNCPVVHISSLKSGNTLNITQSYSSLYIRPEYIKVWVRKTN